MRLSRGAKENHSRPAVDPLFRSAAVAYRRNAIGVILAGNLDDGTVGLQAVKAYGGVAIVQDPDEAEIASMPPSASRDVEIDYCLPLADIAPTLSRLVKQSDGNNGEAPENQAVYMENQMTLNGQPNESGLDRIGTRSTQTCPDCGGTLWTINDSQPLRFRCHTGHAFTAQSMLQQQNAPAEQAVWAAIRALHEQRTLLLRLAQNANAHAPGDQGREYEAAANTAAEHAEVLRKMISE